MVSWAGDQTHQYKNLEVIFKYKLNGYKSKKCERTQKLSCSCVTIITNITVKAKMFGSKFFCFDKINNK